MSLKENLNNLFPFPTKEALRKLYQEYNGDEYSMWHDYGDAFVRACRRFKIKKEQKDWWKYNV